METLSDIDQIIEKYAGNKSDFITGYADLTGLLHENYTGYSYGIVIGRKLDYDIIDSISRGPNYEYYLLYKKINKELEALVRQISDELSMLSMESIPVSPTTSDEEINNKFSETLRVDFSHKMAATRAGLGWIGKTGLLISKKFGPRLRLATILVRKPLFLTQKPYNKSKCGKCNICVDLCPANAANGKLWNVDTDRDEFYNPFKCREQCRILSRKNLNTDISICGICVSVCPIGKKIHE
ncbi:MAG: epoxyqueuosine reductase [Bacteroidales bacterium]|nr:MAG: epoxyqueuosine reductase [Bacteroidales bacterium]